MATDSPKSNTKRLSILKAATDCILKFGIENISTQKIADEAGMAQSGIYYHFENLDDVLEALISNIVLTNYQIAEKLMGEVPSNDAFAKLFAYVEAQFTWADKYRSQVAVLLFSTLKTAQSSRMKEKINQIQFAGEERIYLLLTAGVAEKQFQVKGDIRETAQMIQNAISGCLVQGFSKPRKLNYLQHLDRLKNTIRDLLK